MLSRSNDVYELVSYNIKKYRKYRKMTQLDLAIETKYTHEFIRRIESNNKKKYYSINTVSNIAKALNIPLYLLFYNKSKKD